MLLLLCLLAGFAALGGLGSVAAALLLGAGLTAALGFGVVSVGAGLGAAVLAFGRPPA